MMEGGIRNSTRFSRKDKDWNISCFRIVAFLASGPALVYLAASLKNRHILPNLLNTWIELEHNVFSLLQEDGFEAQAYMTTWTFRRCNAGIPLAILISICPAALICSSVIIQTTGSRSALTLWHGPTWDLWRRYMIWSS